MSAVFLGEEAMTMAQIRAECSALAAMAGGKAEVAFSTGSTRRASVSVYPDGICGNQNQFFWETDFPNYQTLFAAARDWINENATVRRNSIVRRMALAIIEITDEHGICNAQSLRSKFTPHEIESYGPAACIRATEMAEGSPFRIIS